MIKNIVFDFGGVLVEYDFMRFFTAVLGSGPQAEYFLQHVFPEHVNAEMDLGLLTPRQIIDRQQRLWPDYTDALETFYRRYTDIFTREPEGMRALMADLKARGYRLLGLSNWSEKVYEVMDKFDIFKLLDGYLLSKDVHLLKPHADIYHSFLRQFNVRAHECVFIDDKPENIIGARRVGMYGITFTDTPRLIHELEPLLMPYTLDTARPDDAAEAWRIVHDAALDMMARGRDQWTDRYPPHEAIIADIDRGNGYVLRLGAQTVGYAAVTFDGEPAYDRLQGKWLTNGPYATIHRTAIDLDHRQRGLARLLLAEAERLCRHRGIPAIRIDTNHDNAEMLGLIHSMGYTPCGRCHYLRNGDTVERMAFEKVL